jgi:hypothetical protein
MSAATTVGSATTAAVEATATTGVEATCVAVEAADCAPAISASCAAAIGSDTTAISIAAAIADPAAVPVGASATVSVAAAIAVAAVEAAAIVAVIPGACADKDAAEEPVGSVEAVRRASIRIVRVVTVFACGSGHRVVIPIAHPDTHCHLSVRLEHGSRAHEQGKKQKIT